MALYNVLVAEMQITYSTAGGSYACTHPQKSDHGRLFS